MKNIVFTFALLFVVSLMAQPALSADVAEGLVAHWTFNEGTGDTTEDVTGNGHDGTLIGDPQWTDGKFGGALEFDQDGDEVNVPFDAALNTETFTVTVWANVEDGSGGHRAPVSCRDDFPQRGYLFYALPDNQWVFIIGKGQGWDHVRGPDVNLGEWDHIAGVYADGTLKFYVNGELAGEKEAPISLNTAQELLIGAGANERANHEYLFKGKIDDVRVYNRELNLDDITAVMAGEVTPVEPVGKLATAWGKLKAK